MKHDFLNPRLNEGHKQAPVITPRCRQEGVITLSIPRGRKVVSYYSNTAPAVVCQPGGRYDRLADVPRGIPPD